MLHADLTDRIIGAFYEVYKRLKFGYLESIYGNAFEIELRLRGLRVARELPVEVFYRGHSAGMQRLDMVVQDVVVVELKASRLLDPSAEAQLMSYLRATRLEVGLLFHFGPRPSFRRFISTNDRGMFRRDAIQPTDLPASWSDGDAEASA